MGALASKWCPWGNATEKLSYWHYWLLKRLADGIGSPAVPFPPSKRPRPWGRLLGASWIRWRQVSQVSHHVIQDRSRSWGDPGRTKNPSVLLQPNYAKLRILWWLWCSSFGFSSSFSCGFSCFPVKKIQTKDGPPGPPAAWAQGIEIVGVHPAPTARDHYSKSTKIQGPFMVRLWSVSIFETWTITYYNHL